MQVQVNSAEITFGSQELAGFGNSKPIEVPNPITGRLENWKLTNKGRQIVGRIYSDREGRFQDDTLIITSTLLPMSQQVCSPMEGSVVSTQNSNYLLGKRG